MTPRVEYHTIPGVPGHYDVERLWDQFEIGDVAGRSVLDLGCNAGGWSILAALRGASRVVAVDWAPVPFLADDCKRLGVNVEFVYADVCDSPQLLLPDQFDFVLCLSTLHGVARPAALIRNIGYWTRHRAVVEFEAAAGKRRCCVTVPETYAERPDAYTDPDSPPQQPFLTRAAVEAALGDVGLDVVQMLPGRKPCRIALNCSKRLSPELDTSVPGTSG